MRRKLIAGNWKMNKTADEAVALAKEIVEVAKNASNTDVMISPTFVCLSEVNKIVAGTNVKLGCQNMYFEESGAFTGEISADMLKSVGVEYVILGHSERRSIFGETDEMINKKIKKTIEKGLIPVFCIGETLEERKAGKEEEVVNTQTKNGLAGLSEADAAKVVIAYEPVWAIGTGETATPEQADSIHKTIRDTLGSMYSANLAGSMKILYGGSMNDANAKELLGKENIDGGLIGGAALVADKFATIINAANA